MVFNMESSRLRRINFSASLSVLWLIVTRILYRSSPFGMISVKTWLLENLHWYLFGVYKCSNLFVYLELMRLLAATIGANYLNLGFLHLPISIAIPVIKALLAVRFFMHVQESERLTKIFFVSGIIWLTLLIAVTLSDYLTRINGHIQDGYTINTFAIYGDGTCTLTA